MCLQVKILSTKQKHTLKRRGKWKKSLWNPLLSKRNKGEGWGIGMERVSIVKRCVLLHGNP